MMRRKEKLFSKSRDETDDVVSLIQQCSNELNCTKEAVIAKLMQLKNINEDTAKANIDCALCLGAIVVVHRNDKLILKDVATLRRERQLCVKSSADLNGVVLQTLAELGARNKSRSCSMSEIIAHIRLTYDMKPKNSDVLHNMAQRTVENLHEKGLILSSSVSGTESYYMARNDAKECAKVNGHCNGVVNECLPSTSAANTKDVYNAPSDKSKRNVRCAAKKDPPAASNTGKAELRQLQDSLSQFFTPSSVRRSRLTSLSNVSENYRRSVEKVEEKLEESKPLNKTLEIVIDEGAADMSAPITTSSDGSLRSGGLTGSSTTPSPHRRTDQLQDALSFYFSATSDRRKRHEKGEYFMMSNGVTPRRKMDSIEDSHKIDTIKEEDELPEQLQIASQQRNISPSRSLRSPKSPSDAKRRTSLRISTSIRGVRKRSENSKSSFAKRKASKLLRNAKGAFRQNGNGDSSTASNSPKKNINSHFKSENASMVNRTTSSPIKSPKTSPFKAFSPPELSHTESGWEIPDDDRKMFDQARELAQKELQKSCLQILTAENQNRAYPARIKISNYEIDAWYSSPYPQEYVTLPILYICESCLTYLVDEAPHARKCVAKFPPGNEIYRCNNISVFEVDGNLARVYCRNLCLLAKLFIDHKTLYFDVEPFLFYVLTINDERGNHFVGYFSKVGFLEKFSSQKYNLACIVTLPCYQGHGYGRFLIDFSYLLSRREHMLGTPERPLSELGRIAYQSYWNSAILEELYRSVVQQSEKSLSINELSQRTGITLHDVLDTLMRSNLLKAINNIVGLSVNLHLLKTHWARAKNSKSRIWLDESCLRWSPKQYSPSKEFPLRSPPASVINSPIKKESSETSVEKVKVGRRGRRKLALPKVPEEESLTIVSQRKSSAKANKRRKQIEEEFMTDDDDDDFHSSKLMSCKDDVIKNHRRKSPSTDDEMPKNEKPSGSRTFDQNRSSCGTSKPGKTSKSRRFSCNSARRESKKWHVSELSSSDNDSTVDKPRKQYASDEQDQFSKNRIYSTTEADDNSDDSSIYGEPKRKNSGYNRRKKQSTSNNRNSKVNHKTKRKSWHKTDKKLDDEKEKVVVSSCTPDEQTHSNDENIRKNVVKSSADDSESDRSVSKIAKPIEKVKKTLKRHSKRRSTIDAVLKKSNRYGSDVDNDEQDDDICTASSVSSMSPQPLGEHLPLQNSNRNNEPETINMGGEPDIINMGGEPDEDIVSGPTINALSPDSPKAPLAPPANIIEEDEQVEDDVQTGGFFSNQTTSNRSVMESSSHASFEQVLSHRSYDIVPEEFHGQPYPQQSHASESVPQKPEPFAICPQPFNYNFNAPTTSSFPTYNKCGSFDGSSSAMFPNVAANNPPLPFYSQFMANEKQKSHPYSSSSLHEICQESKEEQINPPIMVAEGKGESDMPVLDARTTPRSSPSLVHLEQNLAKKLDDEDDDDAPPQLSPNVPSNDVQPITPGDPEMPEDGLLRNMDTLSSMITINAEPTDPSSANNETSAMTNASYDSSKSVHSQKGTDPASQIKLSAEESTSPSSQYANKFNSSTLLQHPQQNFGAYNFQQCAINQFPAEFPSGSNVDSTSPPKKDLVSAEAGLLPSKPAISADYEKSNAYGQSDIPNLPSQKPSLAINISPPNAVGNTAANGILRNDVISPQEQHSAPLSLVQCQPGLDVAMYQQQQQQKVVPGLIANDAVKATESNESYSSLSAGYLPPTLAVPPQLQPRASSISIGKKSKRSPKEPKEKPAKVSKRFKSTESANNRDSVSQNTALKNNDMQPFSPFMNVPFAPEYMSMASSLSQFANMSGQIAIANSLTAMNSLPTNPTMNSAYYHPMAQNYFNGTMPANGAYQYNMDPSFYNNAWQQYYGSYQNNPYPVHSGGNNSQQPQSAFRTDVSTPEGGTAVASRGRSASTATPVVMGNAQQPMDISEQQRSLSSGGASANTPLLSPNSWSSMMNFGMPPNLPHANSSGSVPPPPAASAELYSNSQRQPNYPMNMHQAYSSYSTHT